ncbi:MAG: hypothetical protein ACI90V_004289 [Bacillariaceae sp.]
MVLLSQETYSHTFLIKTKNNRVISHLASIFFWFG